MSGAATPADPFANGAEGAGGVAVPAVPPLERIARTPISAPTANPAIPQGKPTRQPVEGADVLAPHLWQ